MQNYFNYPDMIPVIVINEKNDSIFGFRSIGNNISDKFIKLYSAHFIIFNFSESTYVNTLVAEISNKGFIGFGTNYYNISFLMNSIVIQDVNFCVTLSNEAKKDFNKHIYG